MKVAAVLSTRSLLDHALDEACGAVTRAMGGARVHLVIVAVSPHHGLSWDDLPARLTERLGGALVLGCSATGVLGAGAEAEGEPGLSLLALSLPGTEVRPFRLPPGDVARDEPPSAATLHERLGLVQATDAPILLLGDPASCHAAALASALDEAYPRATIVGGLAGGVPGGGAALFLGRERVHGGAVGVALLGDVALDVVVSQGARPVGPVMRVEAVRGRIVERVDGRPALEVLREAVNGLDPMTRSLLSRGPMLGVAMNPGSSLRAGDFLVRHLLGVDGPGGGFALDHPAEVGDALRLHVRDAAASVDELDDLLARAVLQAHGEPPAGVWLVACVGRGRRFYGRPHVDSSTVRAHLGDLPLAGFFGQGELGPVRGHTFLHAYTAVVAMLRPRAWD